MKKCFYNEEGKVNKFNCVGFVNRGTQGNVYMLEDGRCLKHFKRGASYIHEDTFKVIYQMNLANFYKIYQMLYSSKLMGSKFVGYVMEYYEKDDNLDILSMPVEYTLENFYNIFKSVGKLNDREIYVSDLHHGNIIMNKDGITVIDIDLYVKNHFFTKDEMVRRNNSAVYSLFRRLYYDALYKYYDSSNIDSNKFMDSNKLTIDHLFFVENGQVQIEKKLSRYRRPIDYIRESR